MTLDTFANIADLVAALGVVASLIFVALEVRKSSEQARLANWNSVLTGLREHKRRTDDPHVASLVVRARQDFEHLSEEEKLAFGYWMEELCQTFDGLIVHRGAIAVGEGDAVRAAIGAFALHFSYPGCVAWYQWSGVKYRWPRQLIDAIEAGIEQARKKSEPRSAHA